MQVAIFKGDIGDSHARNSLESRIATKLGERELETANDGGPRGTPDILGMSQCIQGNELIVTVIYRYRM